VQLKKTLMEVSLEQQCCICGQPLDEENVARCSRCGGRFHMSWSVKAQVPECGGYWIDEMSCALMFACAHCLASRPVSEHQHDNQR